MKGRKIYVNCGVWILHEKKQWTFIVDEAKRERVLTLQSTTTVEDLKKVVSEEYEVDQRMVDVEFTYVPTKLSGEYPPVDVKNERQINFFIKYFKKKGLIRLCVMFKARRNDQSSEVNVDLNEDPRNDQSSEVNVDLNDDPEDFEPRTEVFKISNAGVSNDVRSVVVNSTVEEGKIFRSKESLQPTLEICAMKFNFDYRVTKSDTTFWCIRYAENVCKWRLCGQCLEDSSYFTIKNYVTNHTCAPSKKTNVARTPSARTVGQLIMHRYEGVKEGPKSNDIVNIMRTKYGCELSYSQAWESPEYAVNEVRGIPEKSYGKIPKYFHMIQEANPGTYTNFETDCNGRFKYLFISFGQSVRGFYKAVRRVIVVDGTFLKSKYKGVMLVATVVDGNSNLYPIAFGIADSENDLSWEWFFM